MWHVYTVVCRGAALVSVSLAFPAYSRGTCCFCALFLFSSVFDTQSIPRLSPVGKEKAQSFRLALGLSDEKDEDDAEMVMVMVMGDEEVHKENQHKNGWWCRNHRTGVLVLVSRHLG